VAADVVNMVGGAVDVRAPHSRIIAGRGGGRFLGCNSGGIPPFQQVGTFPQMQRQWMNPLHSNVVKKLQIGTHVIHEALMLKMATHCQLTQRIGARPLTSMHSLVRMHRDIYCKDMMRAPMECTKWSSRRKGRSDRERRRMTVLHINLTI
jgi:hypothetical protein